MDPSTGREAERGIRYAIVAIFIAGLRQRSPGALVNAVVAFAGTYLPAVAERTFDVEFRPWQRIYVGTAMMNHAAGMLGPYDDVWWWDSLTHAHSASVLGGSVFAIARRRGQDHRAWVIGAVVGLGVLWELLEYVVHSVANRLGFEPLLVFYSRADAATDIVFDVVGAVLVLLLGDRALGNVVHTDD